MRRFAFAMIAATMTLAVSGCSTNFYCDNFGYPVDKMQFCPSQ